MKKIILIGSVLMILSLALSLRGYVWEGFEKENLWLITAVEENAVNSMKVVPFYSTEGDNALELDLEKTSWAFKGFISREGLFDLSGIDEIQFDLLCEMPVFAAIGLSTGKNNEWFESRQFDLKRGWNKDLKVDLRENKWKSKASLWENTVSPRNLNDTRKIAFTFFNGDKGKVYLENIRFTGKESMNQAYTIPYEPLDKLLLTNAFFLLDNLSPDPSASKYSGAIMKKSNSLALPYVNADSINKSVYRLAQDLDWRNISKIRLKVVNQSDEVCFLAMSFQTLNGMIWYETPQYGLKAGRNNEVVLNLNAPYFKCEMTKWEYSSFLYNKDQIKSFNFLLYGPAGRRISGRTEVIGFELVKGREFLAVRESAAPLYMTKLDKKDYRKPALLRMSGFLPEVKKYDKFELSFYLTNQYRNPYDPDEIQVEGLFTGPDRRVRRVPGFYFGNPSQMEEEIRDPELQWRIRFTPQLEGKWEFRIRVTNLRAGIEVKDKKWFFFCKASENAEDGGFISTRENRFYDSSGKVFHPFGQSLAWVVPDDKTSVLGYLNKFNKAGINFIRVWNVDWGWTVEWSKPRGFGLGRYLPKDSDEFDRIVEFCQEKDIRIQFCINNFRDLWPGYQWETNPYNEVNGGPVRGPRAFFTNAIARKFFKQKIRYIISRWGYSPALFSWELFNEVDLSTGYDEDQVAQWHREMAGYIRSLDVNKHMVTTSFSRRLGGEKTYRLPEIDYSQTHVYTEDFRQALFEISPMKMKKFGKAHITGEIGGSVETAEEEARDETGIRIHNSIWYSFLSGAPSSSLYWWWDEYIGKNDLYHHFSVFRELTEGFDYQQSRSMAVNIVTTNIGAYFFAPVLDWEKGTGSCYEMKRNDLAGDGLLSKYLQGQYQKELMQEPEFRIDFPKDGKFMMAVDTVSFMGAGFSVLLDNKQVLTNSFPELSTRTETSLNRVFEIDVPRGLHSIRVKNTGMDWIKVKWFRFTNCVPDVEAYAIRSRDKIFIWVRNREFDIQNVLENREIKAGGRGSVELENPFGKEDLSILCYDAWKKDLLETGKADITKEGIRLEYPEIEKDIVIVIQRSGSGELK
ncbi:MAG: DUF5060 domain-containing protein [bacterium]|nr:DUF5060 domain-containing protein [bacterium]